MPEAALNAWRAAMCDTVGEQAAVGKAARPVNGNDLPSDGGALPPRYGRDLRLESYRRVTAKLERHETVTSALAQPLLPSLS
jgi:hypothetical protein